MGTRFATRLNNALMKLSKVLVLFKKSTYQLQAVEHREPHFMRLLEQGHDAVEKVQKAHSEHVITLEALTSELDKRGIQYEQMARADLKWKVEDVDLVISVGGDGTFLDASHSVRKIPLLGVNSALSSSFGHFCIANAQNVAEILDGIQSDKLQSQRLVRLELTINDQHIPELVLNEALVAHSNPAGTSRYRLEIDGANKEEQRSSGILIGTPAGSTGTTKSAGGEILGIIDQTYQFIVREPWTRPGQTYLNTRGTLQRGQKMRVESLMRTGAVYIDGQHIDYSFGLGDELSVSVADDDLICFVDPHVNDVFSK